MEALRQKQKLLGALIKQWHGSVTALQSQAGVAEAAAAASARAAAAQVAAQPQQYAQQQQQQGGGFGNKGKPLSKKEQKKRESELKKKEAEQKKAFAARQKAFKQAHATASKRGGRDGVAKRGLLGRLLSFKGIALFSGAGYMFVAQRELLMTGLRVPIEVVSWVLRTLYSSVLGPLLRKLLLLLNGNRLPGGSY